MRRYRATFWKEAESASVEYECYDEGEPDNGDCKVVHVDEPLASVVSLGADPQDIWKFIFRAELGRLRATGWRQSGDPNSLRCD